MCATPLAAPPLRTSPTFCAATVFGKTESSTITVNKQSVRLEKIIICAANTKLLLNTNKYQNTGFSTSPKPGQIHQLGYTAQTKICAMSCLKYPGACNSLEPYQENISPSTIRIFAD